VRKIHHFNNFESVR